MSSDADNDGFPDGLEYATPAPDAGNYDIRADVKTTRTAILDWGGQYMDSGYSGLILPPSPGGATVRLRFPFGANPKLRLLPYPDSDTLPPPPELDGQLWAAEMKVNFEPRHGQHVAGNALVLDENGTTVVHRSFEKTSVRKRFASPSVMRTPRPANAPPVMLRAGEDGDDGSGANFDDKRFGLVNHGGAWHLDMECGPIVFTNFYGAFPRSVDWHATCLYYDLLIDPSDAVVTKPPKGRESFLKVNKFSALSMSEEYEIVTVVATSELDDRTNVETKIGVPMCKFRDFSALFSKRRFVPQTNETMSVSVNLPGCLHRNTPGKLEIEVMRHEKPDKWEHAAWIMEPTDTSTLNNSVVTNWNGRADVNLPLADGPDIFNGHNGKWFNRAMPEVKKGEPVPPPFYTIFVRIKDENDDGNILHEASQKIFIPQVVRIRYADEVLARLRESIVAVENLVDVTIYPGCTLSEAQNIINNLHKNVIAWVPDDVYIVVVNPEQEVVGDYATMYIDPEEGSDGESGKGAWIPGLTERNALIPEFYIIYLGTIMKNLVIAYEDRMVLRDDFEIPISCANLSKCMAIVVIHEIGHATGLVAPDYLNAREGYHNAINISSYIMNPGGTKNMREILNPHKTMYWRYDNRRYMRFVLPTGDN